MSRNHPCNEEVWPVRCAKRWPVAVILVLACAAGVWLVWLHWKGQPWPDRAAELGGPAQFRPLDPVHVQMSRRLLALAASWWRPTLGLFLLAAGGLLGRVVSAGRQARRISVAAAWTLVALIGVYWVENRLLVATIRAAQSGRHLNAYGLWLQGFAFLEDALLPMAGLVAVIGATTALFRLLGRLQGFVKVGVTVCELRGGLGVADGGVSGVPGCPRSLPCVTGTRVRGSMREADAAEVRARPGCRG